MAAPIDAADELVDTAATELELVATEELVAIDELATITELTLLDAGAILELVVDALVDDDTEEDVEAGKLELVEELVATTLELELVALDVDEDVLELVEELVAMLELREELDVLLLVLELVILELDDVDELVIELLDEELLDEDFELDDEDFLELEECLPCPPPILPKIELRTHLLNPKTSKKYPLRFLKYWSKQLFMPPPNLKSAANAGVA